MKTILLFTMILICSSGIKAQDVLTSSVSIESCVDSTQCITSNNSGILFYDDTKTALYFKVDFNNETDSLVEWLKDLPENNLYFKVVVPPDFFSNAANYGHKSVQLNGLIFFNGFWRAQTVDIGLLNAENSNITINPDKSPYENAKVSFTLSVLPSDFFVVQDGPGHLKETISVSLLSGRVNQLKPGMEGILGVAYNHN